VSITLVERLVARAQQGERVRRVVVLMGTAETTSSRGWLAAFLRRLDELGWRESRNLVTHVQWWNDQPEQMRVWAGKLIARSPYVAVTFTNLALEVLKPITGDVPIVFIGVVALLYQSPEKIFLANWDKLIGPRALGQF